MSLVGRLFLPSFINKYYLKKVYPNFLPSSNSDVVPGSESVHIRILNILCVLQNIQKKINTNAGRKNMNKAVYTAALVADGWAGAEKLDK